jgi:UDP-N-acetylmuramate dehydrogenase
MTLPSGLVIEQNVPLKSFTSWLVGGSAEHFAQPINIDQLREVYAWALAQSMPVSILGGGTNVLVSDSGVRGLVIALKKFSSAIVTVSSPSAGSLAGAVVSDSSTRAAGPKNTDTDTDTDTRAQRLSTSNAETLNKSHGSRLEIECLSGTSKSELLKIFLKYKLEPALFLAGLPGDVGGGVAMNAGVGEMMKPREFVELTDWVEVLKPDGGVRRYMRDELTWSYRHCVGWQPGIISRVGLSWPMDPLQDVLERVRSANKVRLSKQPLDQPSCGSVFVNPPGHKSGQLVESCGLKGFSIGGAQVSMKHANFIVNTGVSTAADIHEVITHVQKVVLEKTSVRLNTEVVYLGEW